MPPYELALFKGCCYGPGQFNKNGNNYFDWNSLNERYNYQQYIKNQSKVLKNFLNSKNFPNNKVYIFIEPNSFKNKTKSGSIDYRQFLHDKNGLKLNALESARLISIFDGIYMNELQSEGYKIIKIPDNLLTSDHFYDAVH